jgi:hypothetical protein
MFWVAPVTAACVASNPVDTARWIYTNQRSFPFQGRGEDLSKRAEFLSSGLYGLLRAEWKCEDREQGLCNLGSDPWTDSNAGEEFPPLKFELASSTALTATVRFSYRFAFNGPTDSKATSGVTVLQLVKEAKSACWVLDDLIGREGTSLKKQLTPRKSP